MHVLFILLCVLASTISDLYQQMAPMDKSAIDEQSNWRLQLSFKISGKQRSILAFFRNSIHYGILILDRDLLKIHLKLNALHEPLNITLSQVHSGHWYRLSLETSKQLVRVQMNGILTTKRLHKFVSLSGFDDNVDLFIGDVDQLNLPWILSETSSVMTEFVGCVANVTMNGRRMLFRKLLHQWCFRTTDDLNRRYNDRFRRMGASIQPVYVTDPVIVREGQSTRIEWFNLYVFPQHKRYDIANRNIFFRVVDRPRHGKLTLHDELVSHSFTYEDILRGRVNYTHDGSETDEDSLEVQVRIRNLSSTAPIALRRNYGYSLPIQIIPVNDAPQLRLPVDSVIHMAHNSRVPVTQNMLLVSDVDNSPSQVRVHVQYRSSNGAVFQRRKESMHDRTIDSFSLRELLAGDVLLVHKGGMHSILELTADDGRLRSPSRSLRVDAFPVQMRQVANTGLSVLHRSAAIVHSNNLSFVNNIFDRRDVQFIIVDMPRHGFVEVADGRGLFWIAARFDQSDIVAGRVRYRHTKDDRPLSDSFRFQVSVGNVSSTIVYDFKISFVPSNIKVFNPSAFLLNNTQQLTLTRNHLFAWTFPRNTPPDKLVYHVTRAPRYGLVYRRLAGSRHRRVGLNSKFTQKHIDAGQIFYRLHFVHYVIVNDFFAFTVMSPFVDSEEVRFDLTFIPNQSGVKLVNRTFVVAEGALQAITNNTLFLETLDDSDFLFTVGVAPDNGDLQVSAPGGRRILLHVGGNFTTQDLLAGRLWYLHDDSETTHDRIYLIARPLHRPESENAQIPFWLTINVILQNDHEPKSKDELAVFHVVIRGERTVSRHDLQFVDDDSDSDSFRLRYTFVDEYTDGGFFWSRMPEVPVYNFTQEDIDERRLLFRHLGKKTQFPLRFSVSDNDRKTDAQLMVNASAAFLRVETNTGVVLTGDDTIVIGPNNLTVSSNANIAPGDIIFELTANSTTGQLLVIQPGTDHGHARRLFTQKDIDQFRVLYSNADSLDYGRDRRLYFRVHAGDLQLLLSLHIVVRSKPVVSLLQLKTDDPSITVVVGGLIQVGSSILAASHPHYMADSIKYTVLDRPKHGSLILESRALKLPLENRETIGGKHLLISPSSFFVSSFSQFDVDTGSVQYLHSGISAHTKDSIRFNVSVADAAIGPFTLHINILILKILSNLTVNAGSSVPLTVNTLHATSARYGTDDVQFELIHPAKFGCLSSTNRTVIDRFTMEDLIFGRISYVHNSREFSLWDNFTLVASMAGRKNVSSRSRTVHVHLTQPNVHAPELVRNQALQMWSSRVAPIGNELLKVVDPDSPTKQIRFLVNSPDNGYLAFLIAPTKPVFNFSQHDIDHRRLAFIRLANGSSGGFSFLISDGLHQIGPNWFSVEAAELNLALEANARLVVAPGSKTVIGTDLLRTNTRADPSWQVIYSITKSPRHGRLLLANRPMTQFTQAHINDRLVIYHHDDRHSGSWLQRDSFSFSISLNTSYGLSSVSSFVDEEHRFRIVITYAALTSNQLIQYVQILPLILTEGASLAINTSHVNLAGLSSILDDNLIMRLVRPPRLGIVQFDGRNWTNDFESLRFTTLELAKNVLIYHHIGPVGFADLQQDVLMLEVFPASESYTRRRLFRLRFNIHVQIMPILDGDLEIKSFPHSFSIVRGTSLEMNADILQTVHKDVPPSNIFYELVQRAPVGYIQFGKDDEIVDRFTQADVNKGRIRFVQKGSLDQGSFTIMVQANDRRGTTRVIMVTIQPLSLSLVNMTTIDYRQGRTYIVLNQTHLGADSNGPRDQIAYKVTIKPQNGTFYWVAGEKQADLFTQTDIDQGRILYAQLNMESYKDSFEFLVSNRDNKIIEKRLLIRVLPAIIENPTPIVASGGSIVIDNRYLDASELEGNAPRFLVIVPPKYGLLLMPDISETKILPSREKKSSNKTTNEERMSAEEVLFFTYKDVKNGRIVYKNTLKEMHDPLQDGFDYELRADKLQPARGRFMVEIRPIIKSKETPETENIDDRSNDRFPVEPSPTPGPWLPRIPTRITFLILTLAVLSMLSCAMLLLLHRTNVTRKRRQRYINEKRRQLLLDSAVSQTGLIPPQQDLLKTTVYGTVGPQSSSTKAAVLSTFEPTSNIRVEPTLDAPLCKVTRLKSKFAESIATCGGGSGSSSGAEDFCRGTYRYSSSDTDLKTEKLSLDLATGRQRLRIQRQKPPIRATSVKLSSSATKLKESQYWV